MSQTAELGVMSGAAVEPGLLAAADAFRRQTHNRIIVTFATTPQMRQRISAGETPDVIVAPPALLDELERSGRIGGARRVLLGRVGVGVAIRAGARSSTPTASSTTAPRAASTSSGCCNGSASPSGSKPRPSAIPAPTWPPP